MDPVPRTTTGGGLAVRTATIEDLPAVERVDAAADRSATADAVRAAVLDPQRLVVVAEVDGAVVGWAKTHLFARPDGPAPAGHYLGGVTVHPAWRRRGLGAALTEARLDWLGERTDRVHYVVNAANSASIALHRRWGFQEVARAPSFHRVPFAGGLGLLLTARLPQRGRCDSMTSTIAGSSGTVLGE